MSQYPSPKKKQKAYLDDFHRSLSGEYIYCGVTYTFEGTRKQRFCLYFRLLALSLVMAVAGVVTGCIRAPGALNCFYVLGPYLVSFVASGYLIWGLCRMWHGGSPLREYVYQATLDQFRSRGILTAVSAGCAVVGEIVYVIRNGIGDLMSGMILFLICQALVLLCSLLWVHLTENSCWVKNEASGPRS